MLHFIDFEVFRYNWLCVIINPVTRTETVIIDDVDKLAKYYNEFKNEIFISYNGRNYDQYVLKAILCGFNPKEINDFIIVQNKRGYEFSKVLCNIPLNNYDVMTSFHGLKQLEGFMGNSIKESGVRFDIDRPLTQEELDETVKYCRHDVEQTIEVFVQRKEEFESQMALIKLFSLPLSYVSKTKPQMAAIILGATKKKHNDEFDLIFPDTLKINKYHAVIDFYKNPSNHDYEKTLEIDVAGVPHVFGWGGLHGAIEKYSGQGYYVNIDVASYYPALMIEYGFISRNIFKPDKYREIRDLRLKYKSEKNKLHEPLKIVLNSTYGAMKDKFNTLYDPRQANNVCIGGQLLLLDLIEKLEGHCQLIQSNTDGLIVKLYREEDYEIIDDICYEWEQRTRMKLEFESFHKIFQKDVNNYIIVDFDGGYKAKGAYVKKLTDLDYDLPIVNTALKQYFLNGVPVSKTITECNLLKEFQKIVKVSSKYSHALYNPVIKGKTKKIFSGGEIPAEKCFRVFASNDPKDGGLYKVKNQDKNPEKFADTPDHCFYINGDVNGAWVPGKLDKQYYINLAKKRLEDFGI